LQGRVYRVFVDAVGINARRFAVLQYFHPDYGIRAGKNRVYIFCLRQIFQIRFAELKAVYVDNAVLIAAAKELRVILFAVNDLRVRVGGQIQIYAVATEQHGNSAALPHLIFAAAD